MLVVGGGIVGASIALELTRAGCAVQLLEGDASPAAHTSTTSKSWAWINSNSKQPASYHALNAASMELWRAQTLVPMQWCGALVCRGGAPPRHPPDYPQRDIADRAELAALEPGLVSERGWSYYPSEGLLEPVEAAELMVSEAERLGCAVHLSQQVLRVELDAGESGEPTA